MNRSRLLARRHARRQRFPQWLSYAPTRPVGRRERAAADDPWTAVKVIAAGMVLLAACYFAAGALEHDRRIPPDPRGYTVQP